MRTAPPVLVLLVLAASILPPVGATHGAGIDGVTASIASAGPGGNDVLFTRDATGAIPVAVQVFRSGAGGWGPVAMGVTLRAFVLNADGTETDRVSINFRSSAAAPVTVAIPAGNLATGDVFDLFVTFSDLGGAPVPTSHHSPQKNALIAQGQHGLAEQFDYHHLVDAMAG